jgi:hypothetical protein
MAIDPRTLQVGQQVAVKDVGFGIQINAVGEGETGLCVTEVTLDYLQLEGPSGDTMRIPLYLITRLSPQAVGGDQAA